MTYTQAYDFIDDLLDKTGTAYFIEAEKKRFLDLAVLEYTSYIINTLESNAESLEKISPLVVTSSALSQTDGTITISGGAVNNFYHLLRAYTVTNNYEVNIMSHNEYGASKNDPFHKPDSSHPVGILRSGNLDIVGTTEDIIVQYIKNPILTTDNSWAANNSLGGYDINCHNEILNIAVRKMMLSLEDPRYQLQVNELTADKR
tara:strand:- start:3120 stop:3728 length:609 start_codon:yes stop_codon:yes gene_type:complete